MTEVLTNLSVINISQYIHVSNPHILPLKLTQCYINYISIKLETIKIKNIPLLNGEGCLGFGCTD